mmetsp:Transcript_13450/g.43813  ORF Transcript_13450/g.43813 Transcript_13450/m.43813 type:complete len:451 (-) Transcript_13450:133-1485(-)
MPLARSRFFFLGLGLLGRLVQLGRVARRHEAELVDVVLIHGRPGRGVVGGGVEGVLQGLVAEHLEQDEAELRPQFDGAVVDFLQVGVHDAVDELEGAVLEGKGPADEGPLLLEVHGDELHHADAPRVDDLLEGIEVVEGRRAVLGAVPEAEAGHVGEVPRLRGPRRRAIDDFRPGQGLLEFHDRFGDLGRLAGLRLQVLRLVRLVEHDAAFKVRAAAPVDQLLDAPEALVVLRDQGGVGQEDHAVANLPRQPLVAQLGQGVHGKPSIGVAVDAAALPGRRRQAEDVRQVALRVELEVVRHGDPHVPPVAAPRLLRDDPRQLPALPHAGAVADEEPAPRPVREALREAVVRVGDRLELQPAQPVLLDDLLGQIRQRVLTQVRRLHGRQRRVLHHGVRVRAPDLQLRRRVVRELHLLHRILVVLLLVLLRRLRPLGVLLLPPLLMVLRPTVV